MSQQTSNSLVNLGDLGKPIDTLIHKISDAAGVLYEPRRIKRKVEAESNAAIISAKAEAATDVIKAKSKIEITDLHRRAAQRWIEEEAKRQKNMEDIIAQAVLDVNEKAKPDAMEDDWIANFFDKCRIVSDSDMQRLWARLLASEANTPGTCSKRTVNFISEIEKSEAELFTKLCRFNWMIGDVVPLMFDEGAEIYNRHGINFDTLTDLESIGFIEFEGTTSYLKGYFPKRTAVYYYGKPLFLEMSSDTGNMLEVGKISLTKIGQELAPICGSKPVAGFYEYVKDQWTEYSLRVKNTEQKE